MGQEIVFMANGAPLTSSLSATREMRAARTAAW